MKKSDVIESLAREIALAVDQQWSALPVRVQNRYLAEAEVMFATVEIFLRNSDNSMT